MSESMLISFLKMLAGFSLYSKNQPIKLIRKYLAGYIEQNIGRKLVKAKLKEFDHFYHEIQESHDIENRLQKICKSITIEYSQQQRFLLLIYLLNFFTFSQNSISTHNANNDILDKLALWLKLNQHDFINCKHFALGKLHAIPQKQNLLIAAAQNPNLNGIQHLESKVIKGYLSFLYIKSANLLILNYNGTSGLTLSGKPIYSKNIYIFPSGQLISAKGINPIYYGDVMRALLDINEKEIVNLTAEDITYRYPGSEQGIKNLNFAGRSGEIHGILGGSGVGKSTLLKLLCGTLEPQKGRVLVNGNNLHKNLNKYKGTIGVLQQEECLVEELTVFENLYFSARASMANITNEELVKLCKEKLFELELSDCQNNRVGPPENRQLSGGQRKRLAIAMEIIREPKILLVDEPTSGLSSTDSDMVMHILKNIALKGKLVVVNIHQPSSEIFKLFDSVLIIDKGGIPIYMGHPIEAILHFKKETNKVDKHASGCECCGTIKPEQIFEMVEEQAIDEFGHKSLYRKISPQEWHRKFFNNISKPDNTNKITSNIPKSVYSTPSLFKQFNTFFKRNLLTKIRNKEFLTFALILPLLLSVIVSVFLRFSFQPDIGAENYTLFTNPNIPSFFFMCILSALFFGLIISCEDIIRDRRIISRERSIGLSLKHFYNAKLLFLLIVSAVQTFLFALPGVVILEIKDSLLTLWFMLFLLSLLSNLLGLILSSTLRSVVAIYILVPFLIVPQILFSGLVVPFDNLNPKLSSQKKVPLISETMPSRWACEGLIVNFFMKNKYNKPLYKHNFKESKLRFRLMFLIPELNEQLKKLAEKPDSITNDNRELLKSGFMLLLDDDMQPTFLSYINPWTRNSISTIYDLLDETKRKIADEYSKAKHTRDRAIEKLYPNTIEGRNLMNRMKNQYHNFAIEGLVKNSNTPLPLIQWDNAYIQKSDPIYQLPSSAYGRAQFYAPYKRVGTFLVETYWFNAAILILMIFLCYLALANNLVPNIIKRFADGINIAK
ncbi:MAG: ATP-binding cassette domain-containing protein [Bacteroidales bacterium]